MTEYTETIHSNEHVEATSAEPVLTARERYGGADLVASILGMLAGLGTLVFLGALFAAGAANIVPQTNLLNQEGTLDEVEIVGAIVAVAVAFVSFLIGGIAAGRMARFDGGMNGLGAGEYAGGKPVVVLGLSDPLPGGPLHRGPSPASRFHR